MGPEGIMVKYIQLVIPACLLVATVVAAPKPAKEGLVSHEAAGKAYVVRTLPGRNGEGFITASLKIRYVIAGLPGETYTVELWLGLPDEPVARYRGPAHFDTQEVTVPAGGRLTEVKGLFDRRYRDRVDKDPKDGPALPWYELKPGTYSLVGPGGAGKTWECRLVVKKGGKVVSDTGYFRVIRPPVLEL